MTRPKKICCLNPYSTGSNSNLAGSRPVRYGRVLILILLEVTQILLIIWVRNCLHVLILILLEVTQMCKLVHLSAFAAMYVLILILLEVTQIMYCFSPDGRHSFVLILILLEVTQICSKLQRVFNEKKS